MTQDYHLARLGREPKHRAEIKPRGRRETADELRARFKAFNAWVTARGGWIISKPDEEQITIEAPLGSDIRDAVLASDRPVHDLPDGQRIVTAAILTDLDEDGRLWTADSIKPRARTQASPGLIRTMRFQTAL